NKSVSYLKCPRTLLLLLSLRPAEFRTQAGPAQPALATSRTLSPTAPPCSAARAPYAGAAVAAAISDPPAGSPLPHGGTPGEATRSSNGSSRAAVSDPPMTQRALAVLVVASAALIVYFVIRTVRLRKRNRKTRRYGVLDTNIENTELTPLEQDDDDDDTTLFDANHPRRLVFTGLMYSSGSGGMMMVKHLYYLFKSILHAVFTNFQKNSLGRGLTLI
uniref:Transmembrane protein 157 n=1 Tax=Pelusios castaneus TaxID=367368 RepID=A0A8C8S4A4_9SAUR